MRRDALDRGEGVSPLRVAGILPAGLCGIGILPMIHGLEGDPQRGIMRWGGQARATRKE